MFSVHDLEPDRIDADAGCLLQPPEPAVDPGGFGADPLEEPSWSAEGALRLGAYGRRADGSDPGDDEDVDSSFEELGDDDVDDDEDFDDDFDDGDDDLDDEDEGEH